MGTDYYETLGLDKDADENAVKKAYRREALQWHPDKHHGEAKIQAEVRFKLIAEAYEVLKDPEKRRIYDLYGEEGLKSGMPFPESTSSGSRSGFMFHDPQEIFREFFGGRDPFQAFFDDPFFSDPFSNDPFFNSSPFSRGSRQAQQTRQSGFRQTNDPFARMGFGDPFFGMGGLGGMGMGMGLLGMNGFGGMNSGMGGSGTSTSFSFSSSSGGSGYASTQTTTRYINGQKTTITKTTDASGNVTETTIVENADGTRRVETNMNGVRSIENSRSASTGVTTRHGGDDVRRIRESESRRSHSHTMPSSTSSSTRRNIPISSPDHGASSRRQPHRERARPEPESFQSSTHFSSRQHSTGYDDEIDYTDGGQSSNDYVDDSGRFNARSRGRPY